MIARDLLFKQVCELGSLRTRTDERHLASKHVPDLGELVEPDAPHDTTYSGNSIIACPSPDRAAYLGIFDH
jgi:hypothetical protein